MTATLTPTFTDNNLIVSAANMFSQNRLMMLPNFLSNLTVTEWIKSLEPIPARRVRCGNTTNISWLEQSINSTHIIGVSLQSEQLINFVKKIGRFHKHKLYKFQCWSCYYNEGEYINQHVDTIGDIQILINLIATPTDKGGILHALNSTNKATPIHMNPGDALIFEATSVPHFTTPIIGPENERLVIAARYFFND